MVMLSTGGHRFELPAGASPVAVWQETRDIDVFGSGISFTAGYVAGLGAEAEAEQAAIAWRFLSPGTVSTAVSPLVLAGVSAYVVTGDADDNRISSNSGGTVGPYAGLAAISSAASGLYSSLEFDVQTGSSYEIVDP